jgi:tetratricopeptide (TPR) repeat protein
MLIALYEYNVSKKGGRMKMKISIIIGFACFSLTAHVLNAETVDSYIEKGNEYVKNENFNEAIECYTEALKSLPNDAQIHYNLGVAYGRNGMWDKAIQAFEKVSELNPNHTNNYYNLGIAYGNIGKWNLAYKTFKKLVQLQPKDSDAHYNIALIGVVLNDKKIIEEEYKILGKIAPDLALKIEDMLNRANLSIV